MPICQQTLEQELGELNYTFICTPNSTYECQSFVSDYNPCENDYCRCGVIQAVKVYFDAYNLPGVTFDSDVEKCLLSRYLQKIGDRFLSSDAKDDYFVSNENFDWTALGGYYGQELGPVTANFNSYGWQQFFEACNKWNQCASDADRVRLFLEDENGYILPLLQTCDFQFAYVSRNKVVYDTSVAKTKNADIIKEYSWKMKVTKNYNYKSLGLICRKDSDGVHYRVIDGYHRAIALGKVPNLGPNKRVGILVAVKKQA